MAFKAVCINNKTLKGQREDFIYEWTPKELIEGKTYTVLRTYIDHDGDEVYFIRELNHAYCSVRFRPLDYSFVEEVISKIKEEELVND